MAILLSGHPIQVQYLHFFPRQNMAQAFSVEIIFLAFSENLLYEAAGVNPEKMCNKNINA